MKRRLAVAVTMVGGLLLVAHLSALAAPPAGARQAQDVTGQPLNLVQAILVALGYFLTNSAFNANLGFTVFRWPLMAGTVVGLIMGDLGKGILIGATINLPFIGIIAAGGSQAVDPSLAGWLGTALAISAGTGPAEAVAIALPLGILALLPFFSRMSVDVAFVHWADDRAEKGDIDGVARMNWVPGQIYVFLTTFIPAVILALVGSTALNALFDAIDPFRGGSADLRWIRDWFIVAGSVLVAVGIAINLNLILRGATIPYFLIGFTISALTSASANTLNNFARQQLNMPDGIPGLQSINLIAVAVLGGALAVLHVILTRRQKDV